MTTADLADLTFAVEVGIDLNTTTFPGGLLFDEESAKDVPNNHGLAVTELSGTCNFGRNNIGDYPDAYYGMDNRSDLNEDEGEVETITNGIRGALHVKEPDHDDFARLYAENSYAAQIDIYLSRSVVDDIDPIKGIYWFHLVTSANENDKMHYQRFKKNSRVPAPWPIDVDGEPGKLPTTTKFIFDNTGSGHGIWFLRPRLVAITRRESGFKYG